MSLFFIQLACGKSTTEQLESAQTQPTEQEQKFESTKEEQAVAPSETSAPELIEDLKIIDFGFGQEGISLGYGFIIENPNSSYLLEDSSFQVAAYDANGTVVSTDFGYINVIFPGQTTAKSGSMFLDDGIFVDKIEVQINTGDAKKSEITTDFSVTKEEYIPSDYFSYAVCELLNPFDKTITELNVSAILFDENSKIIGGGYTYINFIPAKGTTGVKFSVTGNGIVSSVKIYAGLSSLSDTDTNQNNLNKISILKSGFGQYGSSVGFGFVINNPNSTYAIENSKFRVTFFDSEDKVLGAEEGYIEELLPNETIGIGGDGYLVSEQVIARSEVQILEGSFVKTDILQSFTSENIAFLDDSYFPKVTGQINNPFAKQITNLKVYALAFDVDGNIIGAGYTYLDFIPANGKTAVEVSIIKSQTPVTVELYATLSGLSELE